MVAQLESESVRQHGSFDPSRYLTKLARRQRAADGQWRTIELDYMEVKWRLLWLRTEQPEARITTELVKLEDSLAVYRAHVALPNGAEATGWGSETADDWKDFIEKAETKALGRALAALGFGTQFCEDFDFAQGSDDKVVDAPVSLRGGRGTSQPASAAPSPAAPASVRHGTDDRPDGPTAPASAARPRPTTVQAAQPSRPGGGLPDRPATEPQVKAIYAIARVEQAMDDGTLEEYVRSRYNCAPAALSRRQASELIDQLRLGKAS